MRIVVLLLAVVVGLGLIVVVIGYLLPVRHVATVRAHVPATPEQVWSALTDVVAYPTWRGDVTAVEMLPTDSGHVAWREQGRNGAISFAIELAEAPTRLVTRITDKSLPFGGSWEYLVTGDGGASRVQITEHGEVYNPVFRFVSRFIMGHSATASAYLKALGARFGGDVTPEVVAA
ncbi:MAG: SRPBCC family protein [Microbacterium sp.]|uniref:SRPBCC family protein n=1 Tax=Microbacterium sp. TaxID=51671 RepID=UPI001E0182C6|nr:SRPBCC family protein [Microbacterium sp.]MBW8760978.1 SRPBCC family protein [Microbacterium sp.]